MIRTGIGYDIHRLARGRKLILGGVEIPFSKGEQGHSDGDVLIHAIIDAILGAANIADIGELFPPSDPQYKDASSSVLLSKANCLVKERGWNIVNIDCIVICEKPKILPFRKEICSSLANALCIPEDAVFVKGKTKEGIGSAGKGRAIEAFASCLLVSCPIQDKI